MQEIILDKKFQTILPALDAETYRNLELAILEYGAIFPLVLWNGILIDGYNRYKICKEHDIPFKTIEMDFKTREEATIWIVNNQISRRNLMPMQLSYFRGLHYKSEKRTVILHNEAVQNDEKCQNVPSETSNTANRLAEHYNVSSRTIKRNEKLTDAIDLIGEFSPEAKRKVLSGEVAINMSKLETLLSAPKAEVELVAMEIESGVYDRNAVRKATQATAADNLNNLATIIPEIRLLNTIISDFNKSYESMLVSLISGGFSESDSIELMPSLRSFIDQLEEVYLGISKR
jgi:hypothetical protein